MRYLAGFAWSCVALVSSSWIATTNAQCLDWSDQFSNGGLSSAALAQVVFDDGSGSGNELYLGGQFTAAGDIAANGIVKWNGSRWAPLGSGIDAPSVIPGIGYIAALAVFDDGSGPALFAGGSFSSIGGVAASNVAKWNGSSWSPLSSGANQLVQALAVFDDGSGPALYAGGLMTSAGGVPVSGVARWNGSAWTAVGSLCTSPYVRALEVFDDGSGNALYAGGTFCAYTLANVAKWNGTSWSALANGVEAEVHALEVFDDGGGPALFAGGADTQFSGQKLTKWNGTSWTTVSSFFGGPWSLQVYDDGNGPALYVGGPVGSFTPFAVGIVRWNGVSNSFVGASTGLQASSGATTVRSMGVFDDGSGSGPGLYCSGAFERADGQVALNLARYDGQGWSVTGVAHGTDYGVGALHTFDDGSGNALYVGGWFATVEGVSSKSVARWNGATWSPMNAQSALVDAMIDFDDGSGRALYVGGNWSSYHNVARWNGNGWSPLGSGVTGDVNAFATYDDGSGEELYVMGLLTAAGGNIARRIAKWNGSAWSTVGTGLDKEAFCALPFDDGGGEKLFVGGRFTTAGGASAASIATWNGTSWSPVAGGTDGWVYALATHDDGNGSALFAGGTFTIAGGAPALHIAKWNGATWSSVGGGIAESVSELHVHDDGSGPALYASASGGEHLYRWDGATWTSIGHFDGSIRGLASFDDGGSPALYAGGPFVAVDGRASQHIAKWSRACTCAPVSYCTPGTTAGGCLAHITASGTASASAGSGFDLVVSGVDGQRSGLILYGTSGPLAVPWSSGSSFQCVKAPLQRTGTQFSGGSAGACNGSFALDFNAYLASHPAALGQPFSSIASVWAQAWFRDPPAPLGSNLSDAVSFDVCP